MPKTFRAKMTLACVFALCALSVVLSRPALAATSQPKLEEAESAVLADNAGNILWSKNPDDKIPPASITKIMTAMVALDAEIPMDEMVECTDVDLQWDAQMAGYLPGQKVSFDELMRMTLIYSANDAATLVARKVAGSEGEFAKLMNKKAAEIGMTNTTFKNPHGLEEDGHVATARDLVTMGRYAMSHYPYIVKTVAKPNTTATIEGEEVVFASTDDLMQTYKGLMGIKTGASEHGTTFLGSARRNDTTLYTCVLGCKTNSGRFADTASLMDWAWSQYKRYDLAKAGTCPKLAPFAWHFGYSCVVETLEDSDGLVWPDGGATKFSQVMMRPEMLVSPSQAYGAKMWIQDGRIVGSCAYVTRPQLVKNNSFGPFTSLWTVSPAVELKGQSA
ncbi:MAG: D-alanyl-D-alanine carboxypeptidase [Atopobiaceae bacterium]|nr:D-alanyl-D-alanine carboxypeptidase [Atopobiaceae bacterium]